jgi:histidinol-phosphate aminotransferase
MKFEIENIVRTSIKEMDPYASARDDFQGEATVFLDANESPFNTGLNRYPDPSQLALKQQVSKVKNVPVENIFIGNGSDEVIDLLFRAFCEPGKDRVMVLPPSYGMYGVSARINNIGLVEVPLDSEFRLNVDQIKLKSTEMVKLMFLCSPNNPTGNSIGLDQVERLLASFGGLVVLDEAYIDFSKMPSAIRLLEKYPNLVVLQTLSKSWGLAGIRVGLGFASKDVLRVLNKIKPPYNVNVLSQKIAIEALGNVEQQKSWVKAVLAQKEMMELGLGSLNFIKCVYPSDANFILFKVANADQLYAFLVQNGIVIRNRTAMYGCENCLRVSIGTMEENVNFLEKLNEYELNIKQK